MFTDKEITAYRSIKAPDDLRQKITMPRKKHRKLLYFSSAVAACFILIVSGFVINNNQSTIVVNGQKLNDSIVFYNTSSSARRTLSTSISVPIEIRTSHDTKVVVSQGFISTQGADQSKEITISSSQLIWWELEPSEADEFEMLISNKKGVEKVTLRYENTKITVTKENVK